MEWLIDRYSLIFENLWTKPKATVVVLKDRQEYWRYLHMPAGAPEEKTLGMTLMRRGLKGLTIELVSYRQEDLMRVLAHEGLHQFFCHHMQGKAPVWLDEGLACYFENSPHYATEAKRIAGGAHRKDLLPWLLNLDREGFYRNAGLTYPLSWSLMRYLVSGPGPGKMSEAFRKFTGDVRGGKSPLTAFKKRFGNDLKKVQRAWLQANT